ncbi:MAG TPA: hypothetical protein PLQ11_06175 [Beijerinckiaceae bacterium]|nr:hypothetical protein [Beijerinckiaceae bacterium]
MRIASAAILATALFAGPALAGDISVYQEGRSNWIAANQYNGANSAWIQQHGINANGNNYAAFAQTGRSNFLNSVQTGYTDNILSANQVGRFNGAEAYQRALGVNTFSVTQSRRR